MNYWLMKSEPSTYSIDHLKREGSTPWEGVRNYQARNFMKDMALGDLVLFYHSVTKPVGVFGVAKVSGVAHPDMTQFDSKGHYYDPKATKEKPIWYCADVSFVEKFKEPVLLETIKADPKLSGIMVAAPGSRLSVQPVSKKHFEHIRSGGIIEV